jgi:hypothetical protein
MLPRAPLPDQFLHGPFTRLDALAAGVSRRRLDGPDIQHPHHGVFAVLSDDDVTRRCEVLLPMLSPGQWFSHLTAARLLGMPLPFAHRGDEPLHVLTLGDAAPVRRPGVVGWETEGADTPTTMRGVLPVIAPADVWCQLAVPGATGVDDQTGWRGRLSEDWLVAVGDHLVTGPRTGDGRTPLCSLADLAAAARRRRGKRGAKALAAALPRVRQGSQSPEETFLRLGLVDHGLPEPELQVPVHTAEGERHADAGYPEQRVLLEYQGDHHRTDRRQWLSDLTRIQLFEDAGYRTILVGRDDVHPSCAALAARVRRALKR